MEIAILIQEALLALNHNVAKPMVKYVMVYLWELVYLTCFTTFNFLREKLVAHCKYYLL